MFEIQGCKLIKNLSRCLVTESNWLQQINSWDVACDKFASAVCSKVLSAISPFFPYPFHRSIVELNHTKTTTLLLPECMRAMLVLMQRRNYPDPIVLKQSRRSFLLTGKRIRVCYWATGRRRTPEASGVYG